MKKLFLAVAVSVSLVTSSAYAGKQIRLADVVSRVSNNNYKVYENALKVYQAKANIERARKDLLPRLNIWTIAGMILDPLSIVENLTDIAPFLVPGNWFRLDENKLLYLAEREGYRALWGNEVVTAKTLYRNILLDQQLYKQVLASIVDLQQVHKIVKTRETFGGAKPGSARDIEIRILGLQEDASNLKVLLALENDELTYALGFPSSEDLTLSSVTMPDFSHLTPMDARDYEFRVLSVSPERRQYDHFLSVLSQVKKEIDYAVLGVSTVSRGAAGGVFDNIPITGGMGFGKGSSVTILDAQREIMNTQKLGVEETLKRQLRAVTTQYNSDLANYENFQRRSKLAKESKESILRRISLGENIEVVELSDVSRNQILAETALLTINYRVLNSQDRLQRLLFDGDYNMNPPLIDSLKGSKK